VTAEALARIGGAEVDVAQVEVRADAEALPFEAPDANRATSWRGRDVLWLGPDGWLVVGEPGTEDAITRESEEALATRHRSVIDVSANRTVLDLTDGLELLSTGCGIDLDPSTWRPGMCAQTLFGGAQVILHQRDERTTRIFVRPSFAGYVVARLIADVPARS
jgi:heterotetrameric sarcosine oxidase gamma subunit